MTSSACSFSVILFETIEVHRGMEETPKIWDPKESIHSFEQIEKIAAENHVRFRGMTNFLSEIGRFGCSHMTALMQLRTS